MKIPLSNPDLTWYEKKLVNQVLNGSILSLGPKLVEFEDKVANYLGCKYSIAVNSGTSGLHLCIKAIPLKENNEVITTPFSFISSANCILYERGIPVFVDIDPETLNINANKIEEKITSQTKAILPVHVFGQPCEMDKILEIAHRYNLSVIEDACEAIGAEYLLSTSGINNLKLDNNKYKKVGTMSHCGVFGFYPNKQITTGEGGIIVTDDERIAKLIRSLRNQGRKDNGKWLQHEILGYNYRISELNCALGIAQMNRLEEILKKRETVASWYKQRLLNIDQIKLPIELPNRKISWFVYVIRLTEDYNQTERNEIVEQLYEYGVCCNTYFPPIHLQPFYRKMFGYKKHDFPITEHVAARTIALPFFSNMREDQVDYVCEKLIQLVKKK